MRQVREGHRLLVLGYQNIEETWFWPVPVGAGVRAFVRQLKVLARIANVVSLERALDALADGQPLPPRAVALTFDDGYRDTLAVALPALRQLGMPATVYLVPGFLAGREHAWWERLGWAVRRSRSTHLPFGGRTWSLADPDERVGALRAVETTVKGMTHVERKQIVERLVEDLRPSGAWDVNDLFLDWGEARKLATGGMAIGSHTLGHAILGRERAADQRADLLWSRELLRKELQVDVPTLAYPNGARGDYDTVTIDAAREAGYSHALTTWGRPVSHGAAPYEICRTMVSTSMSTPRFAAKVLQQLVA